MGTANIPAPSEGASGRLVAGDLPKEISLTLPESLTRPLWKSLAANVQERLFPKKLPPMRLTSKPVEVGMLVGDIVSLPWYRTVFTNLGNVITPETLPPLELESRPLDIGELISDRLSHLWWSSLVRSLADRIAPEHLPALELTSTPADAQIEAADMQLVRWSSVLPTPKVYPKSPSASGPEPVVVKPRAPVSPAAAREIDRTHHEAAVVKGRLSRSRVREGLLIAAAVLEVVYLAAWYMGFLG